MAFAIIELILDYLPEIALAGIGIALSIPIIQSLFGAQPALQSGFSALGQLIPLFGFLLVFQVINQLPQLFSGLFETVTTRPRRARREEEEEERPTERPTRVVYEYEQRPQTKPSPLMYY